ncbi:Protein kinase-like domain [Pseudocohnilembus persalinus]|uniref:Protein kinase-like domain n=1 Tax=Pseudocohnilembus persalinus TaxID=266149 RepID=A0A0V0QD28_PSEPJ|nr:Protein kinase-like domain [Pseudocohnilembus persalinus]|eukprot:KRX00024.1 Protein kinase-like domain [Pseudocohnilembus persalinus]
MGNCGECISEEKDESQSKKINSIQTKYDPYCKKNYYDDTDQENNNKQQQQNNNKKKQQTEQTNQESEQIVIMNQGENLKEKINKQKKLTVSDFEYQKVLGRGSFGKVLLVQKKGQGTNKLYAMKILKKSVVADKNQVVHTKAERQILQNMNSPFIVQLHYAFQSSDKLYFVMDFMIGGELFFHLRKAFKFNEQRAKLYCAELVSALDYLHSQNIIYRDLKPENILLGGDGHLKITDFGLSKQGVEDGMKTNTFCGTPEYLAPEILFGKGHDKAVDWYSLGCLLYEMLSGAPPFYSKDRSRMFRNRIENPIEMKSWFSSEARSIIGGLLKKDPEQRLGSKGAQEVKNHPFFKEIDWDKLNKKQYEPPFKPRVTDEKDLRHFDKMFTNETLKDSPTMALKANQGNQDYDGFTYGENLQSVNISALRNTHNFDRNSNNINGYNQNNGNNNMNTIQEENEDSSYNQNNHMDQKDLQSNNYIEVNPNFSLLK